MDPRMLLSPLAIGFLALPCAAGQAPASADVSQSVVKIITTQRLPDFLQPWTKKNPSEISGTGVVIDGRRILTNAHVVSFASQIYVQPYQSSDKHAATLRAIGMGIDLAVLELREGSFFDEHPPLAMSDELPEVKTKVSAYGFPVGGTNLSITEGIVSRIDYASYNFGVAGLRIQVDAALNPGNSGGPAVADGSMVGLVFSGIPSADNIGYLIPVEEIRRFLDDIADGSYEGAPRMFDQLQTLENEALRKKLGVPREVTGLVVTTPYPLGDEYPLQPWDVLTRIGDRRIENDGRVLVRPNLRLHFRYFLPRFASEWKVPLTILRGGREQEVLLPVAARRDLVLQDLGNEYPPYFIYGPLVFSSASQLLVRALVGSGAAQPLIDRQSPLVTRQTDRRAFPGEELVLVASRFLPHPITKGYDDAQLSVLRSVNGVRIENLAHLVRTLRELKDPFVVLDFFDRNQETLVFEREAIEAATEEILTDNGIRHECSEELRALWAR